MELKHTNHIGWNEADNMSVEPDSRSEKCDARQTLDVY